MQEAGGQVFLETQRHILTYLTDPEADALLASCDQSTWPGRRDHAMLVLTLQTGLRISEVAGLTLADVSLTAGVHLHTIGKGGKERRTPLIPTTIAVLKAWLTEVGGDPGDRCFPAPPGSTSAATGTAAESNGCGSSGVTPGSA